MSNIVSKFVFSIKFASKMATVIPNVIGIASAGVIGVASYYLYSNIDYNIDKKTRDDRNTRM